MATTKELPPITGWHMLGDIVLAAQIGFGIQPPEDCEHCGGLLQVRDDLFISEDTGAIEAVITCTRCRDRRDVYVTVEQAWEAYRRLQADAPAADVPAGDAPAQLAFDL